MIETLGEKVAAGARWLLSTRSAQRTQKTQRAQSTQMARKQDWNSERDWSHESSEKRVALCVRKKTGKSLLRDLPVFLLLCCTSFAHLMAAFVDVANAQM